MRSRTCAEREARVSYVQQAAKRAAPRSCPPPPPTDHDEWHAVIGEEDKEVCDVDDELDKVHEQLSRREVQRPVRPLPMDVATD